MTASHRRWVRRIVRGGLILVGLGVAAEAARVFAGSNRHTVIPGRVYRSAQPSADDLREQIETVGIRTVLNLRGSSLAQVVPVEPLRCSTPMSSMFGCLMASRPSQPIPTRCMSGRAFSG